VTQGVKRSQYSQQTPQAESATVMGGNTMLWNLSGLDDHLFDDFSRIQREMDELFGTRPARSGICADLQ